MSSFPPISSHLTFGTSTNKSAIESGLASIIAASRLCLDNTTAPSYPHSLIALRCAFLIIWAISDDTKPLDALAIIIKSSSLMSTVVWISYPRWLFNISYLSSALGMSNLISIYNRPPLLSPLSKSSSLLVVAIIRILFYASFIESSSDNKV